jgi:hypothetical protein
MGPFSDKGGARFRENNLKPVLSMDQGLKGDVANELKA